MWDKALAAIDASLTASLGATLAGLSLSAAAFLSNLVKGRADDMAKALQVVQNRQLDLHRAGTESERLAAETLLLAAGDKYLNAEALVQRSSQAIKLLLLAFAAFAVDLLESMTLDPLADPSIDALRQNLFEQLQLLDVAVSGALMTIGLALLARGAWAIFKSMPRQTDFERETARKAIGTAHRKSP